MKLFAASVSVIIYGSIAFAGDMPANLKPLATTAIETDESARKINSAAAIKQANAPRMAAAATTSATLIGSEIALFESLRSNNYGSGTCQNARFYFDGPISPISYRTGDATTISIMAAVAAVVGPVHNQQLTGMITGSGPAASISRLSSPNQCIPSYVSVFSNDPNSFEWAEWLYGMFFNVGTQRAYAAVYNEFHGEDGYSTSQGWYSADGLAISDNKGRTFQDIAPAPNHVIARPTFLFTPGDPARPVGYGGITSIVLSPKDNYFYAVSAYISQDYSVVNYCLLRTNNLDDPMSWRAWDGTGFVGSFIPEAMIAPPAWRCRLVSFTWGGITTSKNLLALAGAPMVRIPIRCPTT